MQRARAGAPRRAEAVEARRRAFLEALARQPPGPGTTAAAAEAAGVHRCTPYRWRAADAGFARRWDAIVERHLAELRRQYAEAQAARERARRQRLEELRPIYRQNAEHARAARRRTW